MYVLDLVGDLEGEAKIPGRGGHGCHLQLTETVHGAGGSN